MAHEQDIAWVEVVEGEVLEADPSNQYLRQARHSFQMSFNRYTRASVLVIVLWAAWCLLVYLAAGQAAVATALSLIFAAGASARIATWFAYRQGNQIFERMLDQNPEQREISNQLSLLLRLPLFAVLCWMMLVPLLLWLFIEVASNVSLLAAWLTVIGSAAFLIGSNWLLSTYKQKMV